MTTGAPNTAVTELFIAEKQRGACRVHGGGFAGVIMAMLPNDLVDEYIACIERATGADTSRRPRAYSRSWGCSTRW